MMKTSDIWDISEKASIFLFIFCFNFKAVKFEIWKAEYRFFSQNWRQMTC